MKTPKFYQRRPQLYLLHDVVGTARDFGKDIELATPISRFAVRLRFLFESLRQGNEVRRSHRERQLERRELQACADASFLANRAVVNEAWIKAGPEADVTLVLHPDAFTPLVDTSAQDVIDRAADRAAIDNDVRVATEYPTGMAEVLTDLKEAGLA